MPAPGADWANLMVNQGQACRSVRSTRLSGTQQGTGKVCLSWLSDSATPTLCAMANFADRDFLTKASAFRLCEVFTQSGISA
jgi:hypothetical protein